MDTTKSYIRVRWIHQDASQPIWLLIELDGERFETRKIEVFADGRKGYASENEEIGGSILGDQPVPSLSNVSSDPQFVPIEITRDEFESAWKVRQTSAEPGNAV